MNHKNSMEVAVWCVIGIIVMNMIPMIWPIVGQRWVEEDQRVISSLFGAENSEQLFVQSYRLMDALAHYLESIGATRHYKEELWTQMGPQLAEGLFLVSFRVIIRSLSLIKLLPMILSLWIPCAIDGYIEWLIGRSGFHYSSPLQHRAGLTLIALGAGLFTAIVLLPIPFEVEPMTLLCLFVCLGSHLLVRHTQKKL